MNKQNLSDLNGYLFEQLERLNDDDLNEDGLKREINRSKAITDVAEQVISNANTVLKARVAYDENLQRDAKKPMMLE